MERKASRRGRTGSSHAKRFPKTLCRILPVQDVEGRGSGDLLSRSQVHAGERDGVVYERRRSTEEEANPRLILCVLREGGGSLYIEIGRLIRRAGLRNLCLRRHAPGGGGNKVFGKRFARLLPVRPHGSPSSPLAHCAPSLTPATASSSCQATGLSATSVRVRHVAHI